MLAPIDRARFYADLRRILGVHSWTPQQVRGLDRLIDGFETDPLIPDGIVGVQRSAYYLKTDFLETGGTFMPVEERGGRAYYVRMYGPKTARGRRLGNDTDQEAVDYDGKGDVQLTGENNYEAAERMVRRRYPALVAEFEARTGRAFDLTVGDQPNDGDDPRNALDPRVSYAILVAGTVEGLFGPPIARYIGAGVCDYYNARRCVNVLDRADEFRRVCPKIEAALVRAQRTPAVAREEAPHLAQVPPLAPAPVIPEAVLGEPAAVVPAAPVPGGGPDDPTLRVTAGSASWVRTMLAGIGSVFALLQQNFQSFFGLPERFIPWAVAGVVVLFVVFMVCKALAERQVRDIHADSGKVNVK